MSPTLQEGSCGSAGKAVVQLVIATVSSVQSLGWKDPMEKGMATQSSILA